MFEIIDLIQEKKEKVKVLIAQPEWEETDWGYVNDFFCLKNQSKARIWINLFLNKAIDENCDLVIFPELSIPDTLIELIENWSEKTKKIIIAGSHYKNINNHKISISPIFISGNVFYTEKSTPAPNEKSENNVSTLSKGYSLKIFNNTFIGNISILICADYLNKDIKNKLLDNNIDLLIVIAFQKTSDWYFKRMEVDIEDSEKGIYIIYVNNLINNIADGSSSIFGSIDNIFKKNSFDYKQQVWKLNNKNDYFIAELNLSNKKPTLPRNVKNEPNIKIINSGKCWDEQKVYYPLIDIHKENEYDIKSISNFNKDIKVLVEKIIANHGIDDEVWTKALSSIYFLVLLSNELNMCTTNEYKLLMGNFIKLFEFKYDDKINLLEEKILVTPEENEKIKEFMLKEDENDTYFSHSSKMKVNKINMNLMHENYLYGLALGITSMQNTNTLKTMNDSIIQYFINEKSRDSAGGWHPYRVPWITARILISFSKINFDKRNDSKEIKELINGALESLCKRLDSTNSIWKSGVGEWVSNVESTALCLEAFLEIDKECKYSQMITNTVIQIINNKKEWFINKPSFDDEQKANNTLAIFLLISVILRISKKYSISTNLLSDSIKKEFLFFILKILNIIANEFDKIEFRQYCTVPQILNYSLLVLGED